MSQRPHAVDTLCHRLAPIFGDRLHTDLESRTAAGGDESGLQPGVPDAVFRATCTQDVVALAREAADLGVPVVPRGAGTGKAGGCIAGRGEVVIDFSRMKRILEMRPRDLYTRVEPGLITQDLAQAAAEERLFYPPDPGSLESCTIGGNVSTNAGGTRAVKYGSTVRYIWGLEVVLAGGEVMRVGRQSLKGVAGYDLTSLLVGSEGTLALVTGVTVHLIPAPEAVETAWLTFPDMVSANETAARMFAAGIVPSTLEVMDRTALDVVRSAAPFPIPPRAGAAILAETDGTASQAREALLRLAEVAVEAGATETAIAASDKQREAMRRTRRLVSSTLKEQVPHKISDDIAVPRSRMTEALERAQELGEAMGIAVSAYGHLGDGNLHVNLLCRSAEEQVQGEVLRRRITAVIIDMGGTITGEHGVGLAKRDLLAIEQSPALIALQRRLKALFDPRGILNPGKGLPELQVPSSHGCATA